MKYRGGWERTLKLPASSRRVPAMPSRHAATQGRPAHPDHTGYSLRKLEFRGPRNLRNRSDSDFAEEKDPIRVLFFRDHEKPGANAAGGAMDAGARGRRSWAAWDGQDGRDGTGGTGRDGAAGLWGATAGFGVCPWAATHHATWADGLLTMKARVT